MSAAVRCIMIGALLFAAGCSKAAATCPANARSEGSVCRPICTQDQDCLRDERCDKTLGVCMPAGDGGATDAVPTDAVPTDGGSTDARGDDARESDGSWPDAKVHRDALPEDATSNDAIPKDDAETRDAEPPDGEQSDAGVCRGLAEQQCAMTAGCTAYYCQGCNGHFYAGCIETGSPPPPCPLIVCPACSRYTDDMSCRADTTCHPVFADQTPCTCAPVGCCMHFSFCAEGRPAMCQGTPTCGQAPPLCEGNYLISYTQNCYEGCVTPDECR